MQEGESPEAKAEIRRFWERVNAAYDALRADPEAWQQELEERAAWDATLADGLDEFPYHSH